jgi:hypothetical protein
MRLLLISLFSLVMTLGAQAATFTFVSGARQATVGAAGDVWIRTRCNIRMEGEIVAGDAERFNAFIRQIAPRIENDTEVLGRPRIAVLCLNSTGGSFDEGIRIAEAVRTGGSWLPEDGRPFIATRVEAGAQCLSACAIVFMAGTEDDFEGPNFPSRSIHPLAQLGFHAPSLDLPAGIYDEATVGAAYDISIEAIAAILRVLNVGEEPGGTQFAGNRAWMNASLLAAMLATPPTDMRMIATVDDAGRWQIPVYPIAEIPVDERSGFRACLNFQAWANGRPSFTPSPLQNGSPQDRPVRTGLGRPEVRHLFFVINELDGEYCTLSIRGDGSYAIEEIAMVGVSGNSSIIALYDQATPLAALSTGDVTPQQPGVQVLPPSNGGPVPWGTRFGGERVSFWNHNGSGMAWESRGDQRWAWYYRPRPGIAAAGVTPGTLLFSGTLQNGQLSGQARRFSSTCGTLSYDVSGQAVGERVVLEGYYTTRDDACRNGSQRLDRLGFEFIAQQP